MREKEFHLLKRTRSPWCPLVSVTSKLVSPDRWPDSVTTRTIAPAAAKRRRLAGAANSTAAVDARAAALRTTPGAPTRLSNGISTRQPADAPIRSAAYTELMRDDM